MKFRESGTRKRLCKDDCNVTVRRNPLHSTQVSSFYSLTFPLSKPYLLVTSHLSLPSPSPPPSIFAQQDKPQYPCQCAGCVQPLDWHHWTAPDNNFGWWYTFVSHFFIYFFPLLTLRHASVIWTILYVTGSDGHMMILQAPPPSVNILLQLRSFCCPLLAWCGFSGPTMSLQASPPPSTNVLLQLRSFCHLLLLAWCITTSLPLKSHWWHWNHSLTITACLCLITLYPLWLPCPVSCHCTSSAAGNLIQSSPVNWYLVPLTIAHLHASSTTAHWSSHIHVWPDDFYVDEMAIRFMKCTLELNRQHPVEQVFRDHFHIKYVKSMFYNHRCHWGSVSDSVQWHYIEYGHTKCGCWHTFLCCEVKGKEMNHV